MREDDPVPESIGGLPGEVWDNFDFTGITEAGDYFFTGDTNDVDTSLDEIMVVNGVIARREGDVIDGEVVSGSIEGAYMNEQGDCAYIWDIQDNSLEALFFNGELLLKEGDAVDIDGDGVIDPDTAITSFTGISTLSCSDRDAEGMVNIYFTADVDIEATGEELEGFFCLRTQGVECFLIVASAPGQSDFTSGAHVFKTQLADSIASHAVLTNDIPEFKLSQFGVIPERDTPFAKLGGKKDKELQLPSSFAVQVMMWNPYEFPTKPEQWTHGLYVVVEPNGRVRGLPFGDSSGMTIWAETDVNDEGEPVVRFPFSIDGN